MNATMGVDIGTSGAKAVVFDQGGRLLASAYCSYDVRTPSPGRAELGSLEVMDACRAVIAQAAGECDLPVVALGVSSQGEAFTAIDEAGRPLTPALVSSDMRAEPYVQTFVDRFGGERLYEITGHTAHPMFTLFKMLWLRDNEPAAWASARQLLCFEDLLERELGIEQPAMGWPLAGRTMLFDVCTHEWSPAILDAIELDPARLARPMASGSSAGTIPPAICRQLGLAEGAVVVTGGHDQPCGALGAGVTRAGIAMYGTGTVDCITPAFAEPTFTAQLRQSNLCTYDHTAAGMYTTVAFSLTGGNILKWFRDQFGLAELDQARRSGQDVYELLVDLAGDEPSGLLTLPYWTPSGTPHFDTATPGAIVGWRMTTTRGEMLRSLLEGVTLEMRLNLEILESAGCAIDELRAIGGGAKSRRWMQLKADVLDTPITILDITEAGCLGTALLARSAVSGEPMSELAEKWIRPVQTLQPHPARADHYAELLERYRTLYQTIRSFDSHRPL
jgi:xylulokinase